MAEQRVLEAASVAGIEFSTDAVAAALEENPPVVEEMCEDLSRRQQFVHRSQTTQLSDALVTTRYRFVHALYQNALYNRVPLGRRARFHRRIGELYETVYQDRAGELAAELALHFQEGHDNIRAAKYLCIASENAARRFANREAVTLSRRGLELVKDLPAGPERDRQELVLQIALGVPLMATEGYGASEVEETYNRARELCHQLNENHRFSSVLSGLWIFYLIRAELKVARDLAEQLLKLGIDMQVSGLLVQAYWTLEVTDVNCGRFSTAIDHFKKLTAIYDPKEHGSLAHLFGQDPGVACRCFASWALWSLGCADQARNEILEALAMARSLAHPQSLAMAEFFAAFVHQLRRERKETRQHAEATIRLAKEHGLAQWLAFGTILQGWAVAGEGDLEEGIRVMREGITGYRATGARISLPHFLCLLAEALGENAQTDEALSLVDEAETAVKASGERYYEAELHRLRGELLDRLAPQQRSGSGSQRAEACFRRAISIAEAQGARVFELRAAMSLNNLDRLVVIYGQFAEGFDTPDLLQAKAVIEQTA